MVRRPIGGEGHGPRRRATRGTAGALVLLVLALALVTPAPSAGAAAHRAVQDPPEAVDDETVEEVVGAAVGYLLDQQGPDGGFGEGARTPNAVSALAQRAQTSDTWSAKEAIDAVSAAESDDGATPLEALDLLAQDDPPPELAAQLISRAVAAMGLDPENFDPAGDGDPVDLVRRVAVGRREDGSYGSFAATAEAVLALTLVGRPVNEATVSLLADAQQDNGGWNADADPDGDAVDPVTTGLVVEALVAAGVPADGDTPVARARSFLTLTQDASGGWPAVRDGEPLPDATAWAMGAIRALGYDPAEGCWRVGDEQGEPYRSPVASLVDSQHDDGALAGTLDPVSSTSLGVQALVGRWLPVTRAPAVSCGGDGDGGLAVPLSLVILVVIALVLLVGSVAIMRRSAS